MCFAISAGPFPSSALPDFNPPVPRVSSSSPPPSGSLEAGGGGGGGGGPVRPADHPVVSVLAELRDGRLHPCDQRQRPLQAGQGDAPVQRPALQLSVGPRQGIYFLTFIYTG